MGEMHSLNGHLEIASLVQDPLRLVSGLRDTILFTSSFKQRVGQSWPVCLFPACPHSSVSREGRAIERVTACLGPPASWWQGRGESTAGRGLSHPILIPTASCGFHAAGI